MRSRLPSLSSASARGIDFEERIQKGSGFVFRFFENDRTTATGLAGYCRERGFSRIFFAGLAYDFCVGFSAVDAKRAGFESVVISDACRAIDVNGSVQEMEAQFALHQVLVIDSGRLQALRNQSGRAIQAQPNRKTALH